MVSSTVSTTLPSSTRTACSLAETASLTASGSAARSDPANSTASPPPSVSVAVSGVSEGAAPSPDAAHSETGTSSTTWKRSPPSSTVASSCLTDRPPDSYCSTIREITPKEACRPIVCYLLPQYCA